MIPILYDKTETAFTSNGLGRLADCLRCEVTEERNGIYECEFDYPISGDKYDSIQEGRIIAATHDDNGDIQPFDIYHRTAPINGVVTFYAHHISYRQNGITVKPFMTTTNVAAAIAALKTYSVGTNPFTYWTDRTTTGNYYNSKPSSLKALLGGEENSLLDVFGVGEYEFDKFTTKLWARRGADTSVEIRYGKNLVDIEHDIDYTDSYNGVVPYWLGTVTDGETETETLVTLPEWAIYRSGTTYDGRDTVFPLDLSDQFEEPPAVADLRTLATSKLNEADTLLPIENIKVSFVQLWQTEEYKDIAPLQAVNLCDTVNVIFPELGVNKTRVKVIKTVYNTLLDRYDEMELGDNLASYAAIVTANNTAAIAQLEDGLLIVSNAANQALSDADTAHQAAIAAQASADDAQASAESAARSAASAQASADQALIDAATANQAATNAQRDATTANSAANSALVQLSVVEDVAGTLDWISKHGTYTLTTDTTVQEGTVYFVKNGNDYEPVAQPTGNPQAQGWYTLDISDSQSDFIMAHLAVTSRGLWVLPSGIGSASSEQYANGYKVLLSNDGMYVYDGSGNTVATYGASITFDGSRPQYIGNNNAYIIFDPYTNTLNIGGSGIRFNGDIPLSDMVDQLESELLFVETNFVNNDIVFIAKLMQAGKYITIGSGSYPGTDFEWFRQTPDGHVFIGNGTSKTLAKSSVAYGETIYCTWTRRQYAYLLNNSGNNLVTNTGNKLIGRTEY